MIIIIFGVVLVYCVIGLILGVMQYTKSPKPPNGLTVKEYQRYYYNREWQLEDSKSDLEDINKQERIELLDEAIIKYNKLLDNLTEQYNNTYNEQKRSVILSKQIVTLEKLNKALEKREKLD